MEDRLQPDLETVHNLAKGYRSVPVYRTLPETTRDPLELFCVLKNLSSHCFMFESLEDPDQWGRYTFLGFNPSAEISCSNGVLHVRGATTFKAETEDPGKFIMQMLEEHRGPQLANLPPFTGGLVGYFSFDYITYSEPSLRAKNAACEATEEFKDVDLMLFDTIIAYDHHEQQLLLIKNIDTADLDEQYRCADIELERLVQIVLTGEVVQPEPLRILSPFTALFSEDRYCEMVRKAQHHIHEGDIFQVVLSNRLDAPASGSLFDTYRILRKSNPSPYMFYFSSDDLEMAGASPETLVKLTDREVQTFPLAGTRPRGATVDEDTQLEADLLSDTKELAEHNMLVDLGRNDVGKLSVFGSVRVQSYLDILRFSHVMHIGSTIRGVLADDKSAIDVIDAILPAGTLSGAPKIRACEIISELENCKRGVYGGAVGYLAF
ncbi:MAG: anthranilate synthase component I family protein, partial [Coriobacteriaceae bacterium]|nr:anthranilate synthase component I family protein [Coriobacteriaceae bacterium]